MATGNLSSKLKLLERETHLYIESRLRLLGVLPPLPHITSWRIALSIFLVGRQLITVM
jgi:hypothetical protein